MCEDKKLEKLKKFIREQQRQDSLKAQMIDLYQVANILGMYDAADFIYEKFAKTGDKT